MSSMTEVEWGISAWMDAQDDSVCERMVMMQVLRYGFDGVWEGFTKELADLCGMSINQLMNSLTILGSESKVEYSRKDHSLAIRITGGRQ